MQGTKLELEATPFTDEARRALTDKGYKFFTIAQTKDDEPARHNLYSTSPSRSYRKQH